jgi:peptide/nickel transport system permease protein
MNSEIAVIGVAYTVIDILHHMILPVLVLTALSTGGNMYLMKQTLTGAMKEKYFMTAKVKGLSEWKAIRKHAIPNAMVPIASTIMISIGGILGGAILTEEVFGIPGMGLLLIDAILTRDIFVEEGTFFMLSLLVIFFNMFSDIMYVMMDPRTRF